MSRILNSVSGIALPFLLLARRRRSGILGAGLREAPAECMK